MFSYFYSLYLDPPIRSQKIITVFTGMLMEDAGGLPNYHDGMAPLSYTNYSLSVLSHWMVSWLPRVSFRGQNIIISII